MWFMLLMLFMFLMSTQLSFFMIFVTQVYLGVAQEIILQALNLNQMIAENTQSREQVKISGNQSNIQNI